MEKKPNKKIAKAILSKLTTLDQDVRDTFDPFDTELSNLTAKLKETLAAKTLDEIKSGFSSVKEAIQPVLTAIESLKGDIANRDSSREQAFSSRETEIVKGIQGMIDDFSKESGKSNKYQEDSLNKYSSTLQAFREEISDEKKSLKERLEGLRATLVSLEMEMNTSISESVKEVKSLIEEKGKQIEESKQSFSNSVLEIGKRIDLQKNELMTVINNRGGGNANRNIAVNGNTSVLSKYTDINLKSGNNITLGVATNDVTKYTDITITSSGSGSGGGISSVLAGTGITVDNTTPETPIVNLGDSSVTAGTYGSSSTIPQFTVDQQGRISLASNVGLVSTFPAGVNGSLQFNDGGVFGGASALGWNKNTSILSVSDKLFVTGLVKSLSNFITGDETLAATAGMSMRFISGNTGIIQVLNGAGGLYDLILDGNNMTLRQPVAGVNAVYMNTSGKIGIYNQTSPTAKLHVSGGTAAAATAPIKIDSGTLLGSEEDGAIESDGTHIYWTDDSANRWQLDQQGGGSGITRVTSIITANTTGGTSASVDYVYFVNDGIRFNLPSVAGLSGNNMYTVKNMANSSVLVVSSDGIDDGATALLTQQYQSLDFTHNGSVYGVI